MHARHRTMATWRAILLIAATSCHGGRRSPPAVPSARAPLLELDHLWIVTEPGAPERRALEAAGLRVDTTVNRHDGQGTASVIAELEGGFLELLWPDSGVRVALGREGAARKFDRRRRWRTSGWSPFGIGLRRVPGAADSLPYATWPIRADYMRPGDALLMLTPAADSASPSVWVVPRSSAVAVGSADAERLGHPSGARRITHVELVAPPGTPDAPALSALRDEGVASVRIGAAWLLRVTLDGGRRGVTRDLRPTLPLVLEY